ncbi:ABC transporter permease [Aureimonas flava]|uniref:ABC transporter permease n=1 Tax=Aureimonas flava TaxID=2320271 RepID=A0A3A1WVW9_9HYPH|nr:ABC transporter permease [Aureimonas flava]RIY02498.1 ABC transporter permease [Aureimonas flava]
MSAAAPQRAGTGQAALLFPGLMLAAFFVVPFGLMIAVSFFQRVPGGFYEPVFTLDNYARFLSLFFGRVLLFSLGLSALVALICLVVGAPFTYLLSRMGRRAQVPWLVALLSVLSLSEVIIGFSWSTLLSRTAGVSNLLVALGLMVEPTALTPSLGAVLLGMTYQALPYCVLVLYPSFSRLDPALGEAAETLGASPARAFLTVILPALRGALAATFVVVFVFALGSYLLPQLLGRPQHWTISVLVTDQAIYQSNMPFAAAMAVFLVLASMLLVALSALFGARRPGARA